MNRTRKRVAGTPGALWTLKDGHITRGGDIERRKKFSSIFTLSAGTRGLASLRGQLYVFGSDDLAATTPVGVQYQRLQPGHASGTFTIVSGQNAANTETVTIGAKVYTFQTTLTNVDGNVHIGANRLASVANLTAAINTLGGVAGTDYAMLMTRNTVAYATDNGDGTMTLTAKAGGSGGDGINTTETLAQGSFAAATMTGGATVKATGTLTITAAQNAADTETVTIGGKVYTFQTTLTNVNGNVKIGADRLASIANLTAAINLGATAGTNYAAAMTLNEDVSATDNADGTMTLTAKAGGTIGNTITTTETMAQGSFGAGVLAGGLHADLVKILDVKSFQGLLYVVVEYNDGNIFHFYNGVRVIDWDAAVAAAVTIEAAASRLAVKLSGDADVESLVFGAEVRITARVPGTAFTIDTVTVGGTIANTNVVANVAGVVEVLATADIEITDGTLNPGTDTVSSIKVNDVEILAEPVDWNASNAATAIRVATQVNNGTAVHGYSASTVDAVVTLAAAPGTGDSVNTHTVVVTVGGSVAVTADATITGGVDATEAVAQVKKVTVSGVIESGDSFTVTVNDTDYLVTGLSSAMGTSLYIDKQRVWSPAGTLWRYCSLADAMIWDPDNVTVGADAGFLDMAQETEGTDNLVVATRYQNLAAVISASFITLWFLDPDPANFALTDTLDNTGTGSPAAVVRYGNNDVFYIDTSGIRSLRARDASNAPFISDVGNAIDDFVKERLAELAPQTLLDAIGAIEPQDGRLWMAAGGTIFILSFFPGSKVSAWSYYEPTEFGSDTIEAFARAQKKMFVRAGDTIFLYGGLSGNEYPGEGESSCLVELPFLSAGTPATFKEFNGFDISCFNSWQVEVLYDPNNEERTINIGTVVKTTFNELDVNLSGNTTVIALKLLCERAGSAGISSVQIHYRKEDE